MNLGIPSDKDFIRKLTEVTLLNLGDESFGGKELSRETGLSVSIINQRLQSISKKTINQFIREIRLRKAMELLRQETVTASEVAFKVGFASAAYFNTCFSEYFGYPPGEARKRVLNGSNEVRDILLPEQFVTDKGSNSPGIKPVIRKMKLKWSIPVAGSGILFLSFLYYFYKNDFFSISGNDKRSVGLEKSIAVLPFINDSADSSNVYFINGVTEAILDNLSKIEDLRVVSRNSVEKYRNNVTRTSFEIARELDVNYLVEGSGQKIGDKVLLSIQLIEGHSDKHLISERYDRKLDDIFNLQSEVAMDIASQIKARITPEEKELIAKPNTSNLAAWEMYSRGCELHDIAQLEDNAEYNQKAEIFFKRAIQLDSIYADPYVQLGWIRVEAGELDKADYFLHKALLLDDKNPRCFALMGRILQLKGLAGEAEDAFRLAVRYNPNYSSAFRFLGELYFQMGECSRAIENQLKASQLENNSIQECNNLISLCSSLYSLGFYKEGQKYADRLIQLTSDSSYYYFGMQSSDLDKGNYESALESALKMYNRDTTDISNIWNLGYTYLYLRNFKESLKLTNKYTEIMNRQGRKIEPNYLLGWIYLENGLKKEADYHLEESKKTMLKILEQDQPAESCIAYLNLTKIYSVLNQKSKALENLRKARSLMKFTVFGIKDFKNCTMLDNIRNEPEFAAFIIEGEAKYQAEHGKVERMLFEEGILSELRK